jgi:hypothetical protein
MKALYIILLAIPFLLCCSENGQSKDNQQKETETIDSSNIKAANTVINFYKWYRNNQNIQNCLVKNSCSETFDSTKFYAVDFDATEKYLSTLKQTGYISDKYISDWRTYFKECDENLKKYPTNDGVPDGFDYVFVTKSQDFEEELNTVEKAKISKVINENGKKIITIKFLTGAELNFELSFINNRWYIDKIK